MKVKLMGSKLMVNTGECNRINIRLNDQNFDIYQDGERLVILSREQIIVEPRTRHSICVKDKPNLSEVIPQ